MDQGTFEKFAQMFNQTAAALEEPASIAQVTPWHLPHLPRCLHLSLSLPLPLPLSLYLALPLSLPLSLDCQPLEEIPGNRMESLRQTWKAKRSIPDIPKEKLEIKLRAVKLLYYTTLYYTILYYTMIYNNILYYTILYYTILYYTILLNFRTSVNPGA